MPPARPKPPVSGPAVRLAQGTPKGATILVVDDQEMVRTALVRLLAAQGYDSLAAPSADEALQVLAGSKPGGASVDLMLTDLRMPGMGGLELLRRAHAVAPDLPVMVITGYATVDSAVEAMKLGARDYITKPYGKEEVLLRVERVLKECNLSREVHSLREALKRGYDVGRGAHLIGTSGTMQHLFELIAAVSRNRSTVLIQGETGTGKELVAKAIHFSGPRSEGPFLCLNCGSVSRTLLESQLFGHVKGAFTGAVKDNPGFFVAAGGGTFFLDEITEVDTETQVKLLRAIQEREVTPVGGTKPVSFDVRIIAATNRDARQAVEETALRSDLYYRLSVVVIELPPLRERREDIGALVDYFNARMSAEYSLAPRDVSEDAMRLLQWYDWPGNVRQLENVIERAFALGQGPVIGPEDLPPEIAGLLDRPRNGRQGLAQRGGESAGEVTRNEPSPGACTLAEVERATILRALQEAGGNKSKAARILGIARKRLYRVLHKHGLMPG